MVNFHSDDKIKTAIPKYSQKHIIKEENIDFKNDTIKIDSLDSSKGILKIYVYIDGKREESNNKDEQNFYTIILKDYEVKNEFQNLSFTILNNIEVNISLKIRNIFGGGFAARMNMFKKQTSNTSESQSGVISTGISMKDRLKLFGSKLPKSEKINKPSNKISPPKIKVSNELSGKIANNLNINNTNVIKKEKVDEEKNNKNDKKENIIKKEENKKEKIQEKEPQKSEEKVIINEVKEKVDKKEITILKKDIGEEKKDEKNEKEKVEIFEENDKEDNSDTKKSDLLKNEEIQKEKINEKDKEEPIQENKDDQSKEQNQQEEKEEIQEEEKEEKKEIQKEENEINVKENEDKMIKEENIEQNNKENEEIKTKDEIINLQEKQEEITNEEKNIEENNQENENEMEVKDEQNNDIQEEEEENAEIKNQKNEEDNNEEKNDDINEIENNQEEKIPEEKNENEEKEDNKEQEKNKEEINQEDKEEVEEQINQDDNYYKDEWELDDDYSNNNDNDDLQENNDENQNQNQEEDEIEKLIKKYEEEKIKEEEANNDDNLGKEEKVEAKEELKDKEEEKEEEIKEEKEEKEEIKEDKEDIKEEKEDIKEEKEEEKDEIKEKKEDIKEEKEQEEEKEETNEDIKGEKEEIKEEAEPEKEEIKEEEEVKEEEEKEEKEEDNLTKEDKEPKYTNIDNINEETNVHETQNAQKIEEKNEEIKNVKDDKNQINQEKNITENKYVNPDDKQPEEKSTSEEQINNNLSEDKVIRAENYENNKEEKAQKAEKEKNKLEKKQIEKSKDDNKKVEETRQDNKKEEKKEIIQKQENKIEKKPPIANKRLSCMLPEMNFNKKLSQKKEDKNPKPKKLDTEKFKMLMGQRIIGQFSKKPNELQKEKEEREIGKSPSVKQKNSGVVLMPAPTFAENNNKLSKKIYPQKNEKRKSSLESKKSIKKKKEIDFGFEILDKEEGNIQPSSTMNTSMESSLPENVLESINYEKYLSQLKLEGKKEIPHETFCEGFFLASFPQKNGQVIENSSKFPASCGHKDCAELPSMKPEIIYRYPLQNTKNMELNNLAATICFPTGIKMCYAESEIPNQIKDYVTQITNQKGERYYMRTFHFYKKMDNITFTKKYEIHPLKHHLSKYTDGLTILKEVELTEEIVNGIQENLGFCQELANRDFVYIPCCLCLISKYPYTLELEKCLDSIYNIIGSKPGSLKFEINDLIMFLIHSIPVPDKNMKIQFYIPCCNNPKIELQCPKVDDNSIMNSDFIGLFKYLSVDNIILIFRLLLSEKKVLFIHDDYTELTNITSSFISLLYPFQWVHTYIPIMSDQMLKYLETFLPFLNGIHISLMNLVEKVFTEGEIEDSEDVFLIYIKNDEINLSSSFNMSKNKLAKYIQSTIPNLPFEKDLRKELKNIESNKKQKNENLENRIRDAFINIFVKMFHDYEKYIVNLDNDVVFNKVLFMQNVPNKEEKTDQFYNEFIDSQLFQQFTQNISSNENSYFKRKIKEFKEKDNKNLKKNEKDRNTANSLNKKDIVYLATPYIGLKDQESNNLDSILDNYRIPEGENNETKVKILDNEFNIDSEKYTNSKCTIYLNPENQEKKEKSKDEENKNKNNKVNTGEISEKQLDIIKENIKDTVVNIFKSQIENGENKALKKKVFNNLETPEGRAFFISLISNNKNTIISLQENSFVFLEELIRGILNSALKFEETDQLIEEIVILILSTKFFETNTKNKNGTIFNDMQKFLHSYSKITQKNLWQKWFDLEFKRKKEENLDENDAKEEIILDICKNMIFLQISKSIVKNVTESINKIVFEEGSEIYEQIKKKYTDLIINANYISQAK